MKVEDFETLIDCCQVFLNDGKIQFVPYLPKDNVKVAKIIVENNLGNLSVTEFNEIAKRNAPLYQVRKKIREQKLDKYNSLSPVDIAKMPMEEKVTYLELLFPRKQTKEELRDVCNQNAENLRACLFNLNFPESFWKKEKKQADRYAALIANSPQIIEKIKAWNNTTLEEKKEVVRQSLEIFEYVYGKAPRVEFFTEAEEKKRFLKFGYPENTHVNAAEYGAGTIRINEERLQNSHSLFAVSVLFHEGTHFRQDVEKFEDPLMDRIFDSSMDNAVVYESELNNKNDNNYRDLYTMMPFEVHAYGLQEYMENGLIEKIGIEKDNSNDTPEVKKVHSKGYTMAKINQSRS